MAKEIIYEWAHPSDLVLEVMGAVEKGTTPSLHKLWSILADPRLTAKHDFGLIDASGKEIDFPLKLISDTSIISVTDE